MVRGGREGESKEREVLIGVHLGVREKFGSRETPQESTRIIPAKTSRDSREGA